MTCLFIGGYADGRRISVPDQSNSSRYRIPRTGGGYDEYRREQLASSSQRFTVFVYHRLTPTEAMQMLIDGYRRPAQKD